MIAIHIVNGGIKVETASGFFLTEGVDFRVIDERQVVEVNYPTQPERGQEVPQAASHPMEDPEAKPIA